MEPVCHFCLKCFDFNPVLTRCLSDGLDTRVYLVEASMEDFLHLFVVECDSLDLAALVFIVEGHSLAGG